MENKFKLPTETVELPSKGLLYSKEDPLSSGKIEMKYMGAIEEDILTNTNFIKQGTVIDKLLQSLIVSPINYDNILIGDKNVILVAARILGYGKDYTFKYINKEGEEKETTVDLSLMENKPLKESLFSNGVNEFSFTLPHAKNNLTFKLLTHGDEKKIEAEIKALKKLKPQDDHSGTTRLKYIITSVDGDREQKTIREFVDHYLMAKDSRELRKYYSEIQPDIDLVTTVKDENGVEESINVPISINFFWPDAGI